jgi:hypothetical protein
LQTRGKNFSGFNQVDWGQVGVSSAIGGVAGFAGGAAGYWASGASFAVNGISSPVARSAVVSSIAAGAGHIAGGTTANLIAGQNFGDAFVNSFEGIGKSMAMGMAIGVATTIGVSYANGINPWTGKSINHTIQSTTDDFFEGSHYSDKVLSQMENTQDIRHGFPRSVDGYANEYGYRYTRIGGDGQIYQYLELSGTYKGQTGVFQYIKGLMELLIIGI